jgi:hypothetical protein
MRIEPLLLGLTVAALWMLDLMWGLILGGASGNSEDGCGIRERRLKKVSNGGTFVVPLLTDEEVRDLRALAHGQKVKARQRDRTLAIRNIGFPIPLPSSSDASGQDRTGRSTRGRPHDGIDAR